MRSIPELFKAWKASARGTFGTVADGLTILITIVSAVTLIKEGVLPQAILAATVCLLAVVFLGVSFNLQGQLVRQRLSVARSVQLGRALPKLATATANLARAAIVASRSTDGFVHHAENACKELAELYAIATGRPCRVTLLETYGATREGRSGAAVRPVCSSYTDSGQQRGKTIDWVADNSDFTEVMASGDGYFFCNDLPAEIGQGYQNSHWSRDKIVEMRRNDSFPYRSTIVWPVRGWDPEAEGGAWRLSGFVCVDSQETGVFDQTLDVAAGQAFGCAVYYGLESYIALRDTQATKGSSE